MRAAISTFLTAAALLAAHIANAAPLGELTLTTSLSVGIALYPQDGTTAEKLIASSDRALYGAKALGKNCFASAPDPALT